MPKTQRMNFIPELREQLQKNLETQGISRDISGAALEKWDAGKEPTTPWERGCFSVFDKVQSDIEAAS